jgi:hypothetical protein
VSTDYDEVREVSPPAKGRGKRKKPHAQTLLTNGVDTGLGKGKAKAGPGSKRSRTASEPLDVADVELMDGPAAITMNKQNANARSIDKGSSLKEMERVLKRLREVNMPFMTLRFLSSDIFAALTRQRNNGT